MLAVLPNMKSSPLTAAARRADGPRKIERKQKAKTRVHVEELKLEFRVCEPADGTSDYY